MRAITLLTFCLFSVNSAHALDWSPWNDNSPPARAITSSSVAAAPAFGYDASRPHTEWAADFAPFGYGEYGKVISRRYVDGPNAAPTTGCMPTVGIRLPADSYASYTPTYSPPLQTYQPAVYQPAYQPTYAPQYSSAPAYGGGFSFGGSRCGPGGCRQ